MEIEEAILLFLIASSGILVFIYSGTLVMICKGTWLTKVFVMTTLLLLSNIATIFVPVCEFEYQVAELEGNKKKYVEWTWFGVAMFFIMNILFNEAHWILADCYRKSCNNVKRHVEGTKQSQQEADADAKIYWLGLALNALFPILSNIFLGLYDTKSYDDQQGHAWLRYVGTAGLIL